MKFNEMGLQVIAEFEGCRLDAYEDQAGKWTIGFGCCHHVRPGQQITQQEALDRLREDVSWTIGQVAAILAPHQLNDNQFSSLVAFAFNVGVGAFKGSTLLNCIKTGHVSEAGSELLRWSKIDGQTVAGLLRRRQAEMDLFNTPA